MVPSTGEIIFKHPTPGRSPKKKYPEKINQEKKKLDELVEKSSEPLIKASTVIPFTLFPTDILIDVSKVTIITREFFSSETLHSILIQNIEEIAVETSPWFATLKIVTKGFHDDPTIIKYLSKKDALDIKNVIQGLTAAEKNKIDLTKIDPQEILGEVAQLGQTITED